jgi:hypothetical protein
VLLTLFNRLLKHPDGSSGRQNLEVALADLENQVQTREIEARLSGCRVVLLLMNESANAPEIE